MTPTLWILAAVSCLVIGVNIMLIFIDGLSWDVIRVNLMMWPVVGLLFLSGYCLYLAGALR